MTGLPGNIDVSVLDDGDLRQLVAVCTEELIDRAVRACDPAALLEVGFQSGFASSGTAVLPWVIDNILVCPGVVIHKSKTSHDCTFVSIDECWVWEHDETLDDEVRKVPVGNREHQRSVSLVPVWENMTFDVVSSRLRSGEHKMTKVQSFKIVDGDLELVSSRTPKVAGHGR